MKRMKMERISKVKVPMKRRKRIRVNQRRRVRVEKLEFPMKRRKRIRVMKLAQLKTIMKRSL